MSNADFDGIWNELEWESHLTQCEQKSATLRDFVRMTWGEESPSWERLLVEYNSVPEALDAFVEEELMFEESYFPDEEDDLDEDDELDDDLFGFEISDDEEDENFIWQLENGFGVQEDEIELDIYESARTFSIKTLRYARKEHLGRRSRHWLDYLNTVVHIPAKLAAAYTFGFDEDVLGANIVYCKRGLVLSNKALDQLRALRRRRLIRHSVYLRFYEELSCLRNDLGVYIQELRDLFMKFQQRF